VVIGAGPYGLSVAAHLRGRGIAVRTFGVVMDGWHTHMPAGMFLKSTPSASSLSAPGTGSTLADFCAVSGTRRLAGDDVLPIDLFIRYGQWFAEQNVPDVEDTRIRRLEQHGQHSLVTLESGEQISTPAVVIATGMAGYAHLPGSLAPIAPDGPSPDGAVSHTWQHASLAGFTGREVAVIGAGQSALESAALLHEAGANVQLVARREVKWGDAPATPSGLARFVPPVHSPLGPTWKLVPFSSAAGAFRYLPAATRLALVEEVLGPFGAWWLRDRVIGQFPVHTGQQVIGSRSVGDNVVLTLGGLAGQRSDLKVDHVLAATGYQVDLAGLDFMDDAMRRRVRCVAGSPRLSGAFESSVPGVYFTGLASAATFGPLMRFVCGSGFAARRVSHAVAERIRSVSRA
jgi:thioredoxin reductase